MTTWCNDVHAVTIGMGVHGEHARRLGHVREGGANGMVVRLHHDVYVPFAAVRTIYADQVVVALAEGHLPTIEGVLLDDTQEEIPGVEGYTVPNTSIFY